MEANEQFLFLVEVKWLVVRDHPSQHGGSREESISEAQMHPFSGTDEFHLVVPDRQIATVDKAVARLMDEDHGVDRDTDDYYVKKEFVINKIQFLHSVRL